jgi:hypothetical protein
VSKISLPQRGLAVKLDMAIGSKAEKQEELFYASEQVEAPGAPVLPEAERSVERSEVRRVLRRASLIEQYRAHFISHGC